MRRVIALSVAALAIASSCRLVASIDDRAVCPGVAGNDACASCRADACCAEEASCADDAACVDAEHCLASCAAGDDPCRARCRAAGPTAFASTYGARSSCTANHCTDECGVACGGWIYPGSDCRACAERSCCAEATACSRDAACVGFSACASSCDGDADCDAACLAKFSSGLAASQAFGTCVQDRCASVCKSGWECIGEPPKPSDLPVTFSMTLLELLSMKPVSGVSVRACPRLDPACMKPDAGPATSDAQGYVSFSLPSGWDGYFELSGGTPEIFPSIQTNSGAPLHGNFAGPQFVLSTTTMTSLTHTFLHDDVDPSLGHMILSAVDCQGKIAAGVSFSIAGHPEAVAFYLANQIPSRDATETDDGRISAGGFENVAPGAVTTSARIDVFDTTYAERTLLVRAGWLTFADMTPTSR